MRAPADRIPGVNITVDELIAIRRQLLNFTMTTSKRQSGYRSGLQDSRLRGRGMEYEESRPYIAGDDMRSMDWRVMARTGKPHTKVFAESRERHFLLAVDLSASMYFGTRHGLKSWAAAHTAAHAGWLANFAANHIGGLIVSPHEHHEVRPGKRHAGLLRLFQLLASASNIDCPTTDDNRLNFLLQELLRVVKPGSIIAVISDFIGLDETSKKRLAALAKHNDLVLFWITDEFETTPWAQGRYPVTVLQQQHNFDLTQDETSAWLKRQLQNHRQQIESVGTQLQLPLFPISCNHDITHQIAQHWGSA